MGDVTVHQVDWDDVERLCLVLPRHRAVLMVIAERALEDGVLSLDNLQHVDQARRDHDDATALGVFASTPVWGSTKPLGDVRRLLDLIGWAVAD